MKSKINFSLFAALLNIYSIAGWIYVFNKYPVHLLRVTAYKKLFFGLSVDQIDLLLAIITVVSIVLISSAKLNILKVVIITIHLITLLLMIWSRL